MDIKTMPKDTLAELLAFLADNEEFDSIRESIDEGLTVEEVRCALRELSMELKKEAANQLAGQNYNASKDRLLSKETKTMISYLSPREEKRLLTAFGLIERPARG